MRNPSRTLARMLPALCLASILAGCGSDGDTIIGSTGGILNNNDSFPSSSIFSNTRWPEGSGFAPNGTPAFDVNGRGAATPTDVNTPSSNPALGSGLPYAMNDIRFVAYASALLAVSQINFITSSYNNGRPNAANDVVIFPSYGLYTPEDEEYDFFQINLKEYLEMFDGGKSADPTRQQVVGIAFGNGAGGYVPVAPNTADTFAGALLYTKATRVQDGWAWNMDQRDCRDGTAKSCASSMRMILRGDTMVAIIRRSELEQYGATQFRWDTYSFAADPSTDWSHDFTDWVPFGP